MCLQSSALPRAIALVATLAVGGVSRAAELTSAQRAAELVLDDYLESKSLLTLREALLERLMAQAPEQGDAEVASRLARVYTLLMESAASDAERSAFEAKCESLLEKSPGADTLELRLSLARARYVRAEQVAERFRLGLAPEHEAQSARSEFVELAPIFDALAEKADSRVRELERQLEAGAPRDELMTSAVGGSRRVRSMSRYLGGWSAYYMAELDATGRDAAGIGQAAQIRFGALLEARRGIVPTRDRVAPDMLKFDHVARSALGVGLCWSLRGNFEEALSWIDLVESAPQLDEGVRSQIPARRMIVLARAQEWGRLASYVDRLVQSADEESSGESLSTADARLLAALTITPRGELSGAPGSPEARLLIARHALTALIRAGQGVQALDFVAPFLDLVAPDERASAGFVPRYLRALREYDAARAAQRAVSSGADAPTRDPDIRRRFQSAQAFIDGALAAYDATDFADVRPQAQLIRALAGFFSAEGVEGLGVACDRLVEAADALEGLSPQQAIAARRLAIRALDLAAERAGSAAGPIRERRSALINAFIAAHPEDAAAGAYAYQRATSGEVAAPQSIEGLLLVDGSEPLRIAARHEAGRLLYERYLNAPDAERAAEARRFLLHASALLEEDRQRLVTGDEGALAMALMNARRTIDVALWFRPPETELAIRAYDLMASLQLRGAIESAPVEAEFHFRAVQIALLRGDEATAESEARLLQSLDERLAQSAQRELYRYAFERWSATESLDDARSVVRHGSEVLRQLPPLDKNSPDHAAIALSAGVARAGAQIWELTQDEKSKELATILFRTALRADPRNRTVLEAASVFFERTGEWEAALDALRSLLAGQSPGGEQWFATKVRLVAILVEKDPTRARLVLDQHRALYPDMGPTPFGEQLTVLEGRLGGSAPSEDSAP